MMYWRNEGWSGGMWSAMGFLMVIFWGVAISLGVWLVRRSRYASAALHGPQGLMRADMQLAERFARGEMDEAQFTRARSILQAADNT